MQKAILKIFENIRCNIFCILSLFRYVKCQNNFVKVKIDKYENKKFTFIIELKDIKNIPKIDLETGGTMYLQDDSKLWNLKGVRKFIKIKYERDNKRRI